MNFIVKHALQRQMFALRGAWYMERRTMVAAGVLIFITLTLLVPIAWHQRMALHAAEQEIAAVRDRLLRPPPVAKAMPVDAGVAAYPDATIRDEVLREIAFARERHGLSLGEITISSASRETSPLQRTEYLLTATGAFPKVRAMLSGLLVRYPTLALESIDVRRPVPESPLVEAQLRFALYTRRDRASK